jgi:DNA-binding transcriptional LysR family regulator
MTSPDDYRLFVRLVDAGGLSAAARQLNSSPPAMSRRLAALEDRLGVRLVERTARRFLLTAEGSLLYERAVRIVAEMNDFEAELTANRTEPSGLLRIGAPMEFGRRRIAPLLGEFGRLYPKIACELILSDAGQEPVRDELDFVLRTTPPEDQDVVCVKFLSGRRVICAAPVYLALHEPPSSPEDLITQDCLRIVRGRRTVNRWQFVRDGLPLWVTVGGSLSSTSGEVIHGWALEGRGIAFKAEWDIVDDLKEGSLVECLHDFSCYNMHFFGVSVARSRQPARVRMLVDFLKSALKASFGELDR